MIVDFNRIRRYLIVFLCVCIAAFGLTFSNVFRSSALDSSKVYMPIMMYHHVLDKKALLNKYTVSPEEFENDLKYIKDKGYTTILVSDLINFCENKTPLPKKPIIITFDDGYESVFKYAYPLLKKYNMKAVINVIGRYADLYSEVSDHNVKYAHITWPELNEALKSGMIEVQNHSYNMHSNTNGRNGIARKKGESLEKYQSLLSADLAKNQQRISEMTGITPTAFAYPFGKLSKDAVPVIKQLGFKAIFCCWEHINELTGDSEELYHLNRYNRPHGTSTEKFFGKIEVNLPS